LWQTEENKIIRIWQPKGCDDGEINGIGFQDRPCDPAWWDELMSFKTADDELIVLTSDAQKLISREFPKFLREKCGLTSKRPVHRLRKWAGHRTMRQNDNNPFIAQKVLGHSSIMMTTKIYVGLPTVNTGTLPHKTTNKEI
jgi:integrase